jgi:DNA polymerase-3 subunit alpha
MLKSRVTHSSGQLSEAGKRERVCVAGMVARFRAHTTKEGKAMGFVTLEDAQGNIEMVVFPKVWEQFSHLIEPDRVLIAEGKVDAEGGDPKLLVDRLEPAPIPGSLPEKPAQEGDFFEEIPFISMDTSPQPSPPAQPAQAAPPVPAQPVPSTPLNPSGGGQAGGEVWDSDQPPALSDWDLFPPNDDWMTGGAPGHEPAAPVPVSPTGTLQAASPRVEYAVQTAGGSTPPASASHTSNAGVFPLPGSGEIFDLPTGPSGEEIQAPDPDDSASQADLISPSLEGSFVLPPFIISPTPIQAGPEHEPRMITIILRSSGDKEQDVRRLKCVHGALKASPGHDRFALHVFEKGRRFLLEFPNESTGISPDLISKLTKFVREENIRIDPIKIH